MTTRTQVDYEREAALAGVRTMIHDLEGPVRRAASFFCRDAVDVFINTG